MINQHCLICDTPSKHSYKMSIIRNINCRLHPVIAKFNRNIPNNLLNDRKYRDFYFNIKTEHSNIRAFCGHCFKINPMEIRNEEDLLYENYAKIVYLYKNNFITKNQLYDYRRLIQGHYNILSHKLSEIMR